MARGPANVSEPPEPALDDGIAADKLGHNALWGLLYRLGPALLTAALSLYLVRALQPHEFGLYSLAMMVGSLALLPSDFGVSTAASRYVAAHRADRAMILDVLGGALALKLVGTGIACAALLLLAEPIADAYDEPSLAWPVRWTAIALVGQNLMLLWGSAFTALGRVRAGLPVPFVEGGVELGAGVAFVMLGWGAAGATLGRAIGYATGAVLAGLLLRRLIGSGFMGVRGHSRSMRRKVGRYAGPSSIVDGAYTAFTQVDVLVIGALLNATAAGMFTAPLRVVTLLHYPATSLAGAVAPRLAHQGAQRRDDELVFTLRLSMVIQAALATVVVVWADPVVRIFLGPQYLPAIEVLQALGLFIFLSGIAPIVTMAASFLGQAPMRVPLMIVTVLVNLVVDLALVPSMGIVGGAIGSTVAYLLFVPGHFWLCRRVMPIRWRPLMVTLLRCAAAAAAMAGVLLAWGTTGLGAVEIVLGGASALAVYAAVLFALGERPQRPQDLSRR
jgi:O-antigen/teichoic acid export membrane protein